MQVCYPPFTYLQPTGRVQTVCVGGNNFKIVEVQRKLQVTGYKVRMTSYKRCPLCYRMQAASYKLQAASRGAANAACLATLQHVCHKLVLSLGGSVLSCSSKARWLLMI